LRRNPSIAPHVIALEVACLGIGNEGNPIEIDRSDALAAHIAV
jgi:hypothetical protein